MCSRATAGTHVIMGCSCMWREHEKWACQSSIITGQVVTGGQTRSTRETHTIQHRNLPVAAHTLGSEKEYCLRHGMA